MDNTVMSKTPFGQIGVINVHKPAEQLANKCRLTRQKFAKCCANKRTPLMGDDKMQRKQRRSDNAAPNGALATSI